MFCTILGCGGSLGVPQLLCKCNVCLSNDPKNKRSRASILIASETTNIVIDITPDFRQQALDNNINKIDAVLFTHLHSDHISGVNDLLPFTFYKERLPAYMTNETFEGIVGSYGYLFNADSKSLYKSRLDKTLIDFYQEFKIGDITVKTFKQQHGNIASLGLRIGNLAYSTDFNGLPNEAESFLKDLDIWIIDCLRYTWSPSHLSYEQVFEFIDKYKPKRAILTHLSHKFDYMELKRILPINVEPAFDKMVLNFQA